MCRLDVRVQLIERLEIVLGAVHAVENARGAGRPLGGGRGYRSHAHVVRHWAAGRNVAVLLYGGRFNGRRCCRVLPVGQQRGRVFALVVAGVMVHRMAQTGRRAGARRARGPGTTQPDTDN